MKKKLQRGKPLEELVKGSLEYTRDAISNAFRQQFPYVDGVMTWYGIVDTFADYVIVSAYGELQPDEFYRVTYTRSGESFTFAAKDQWEVVELAYQPQTQTVTESKKRKAKKFEERVDAIVSLEEAQEGNPRRIKIEGAITAGVVNGNGRRYPVPVIEAAIAELRGRLNESAGQGRAKQILGEAEHPSDKGGRASLLETVTKWEDVSFNGQRVDITGRVLETSRGKDILTLMEGGVLPGVSLRGYGDGKTIKEGSEKIFEVTELHITGFDLVLEPSFENTVQLVESQNSSSEDEMTLEELLKLLKDHPELFEGLTEAQLKKLGDAQLKALEEKVREALGIDAKANITESLKAMTAKARQFDEAQKQTEVANAIAEACKDLPFGDKLNKQFTEAMKASGAKSADEVKAIAEAKRKEYGAIAAELKLGQMGFTEGRVSGVAPVIESETGTPEFARGAFMLQESILRRENRVRRDLRKAVSPSELLTVSMLERFDALNKAHLMAESRLLQEAELTTDLNLPYSVSRAIIEEAFPSLVAANIFDTGVTDVSPMRLFFETFSGETGYSTSIGSSETVALTLQDTWYDMAHGRVTPGTVVVKNVAENTTYVENTDYAINYAEGKIKSLTGGSILAATSIHITAYSYTAIRQGEMAPIERGKITLSYLDIAAKADRLADQISREAIVFSRSQLGMDAVTRTLSSLVKQTQRKIDQGMLYMARTAVMAVASNSAGAWVEGTTQDDYSELVRLIGAAKVLVGNRYYQPNFILCSLERAEDLSNWDGFKRDGFPNAILNAAGFAGGVKSLPIFASTEFPDTDIVIGNRELVMYRVFQPMRIFGPYPTYDVSGGTSKIIAADQYYTEEFNVTVSPVQTKGAYLTISEGS